jgi:thioredoxin reductase (NADPH)
MDISDVVIVGAGPSGLATAIAAGRLTLAYTLLEKGALVNSIYHFPTNMVFFTTPELLEIGGLPFVTPNEKPTRLEALRYYRRVVDALGVKVTFGQEVLSVDREANGRGGTEFAVVSRSEQGRQVWHALAVVMATGFYDHPNLIGVPGEDLPHVSHYYKEAHTFFRKQVVVVGGSNSAAEAALDLCRNGAARVTLVHRWSELSPTIKYWVLPDLQNRIKEGSIQVRLNARVREIRPESVVIERGDEREELPADAVLLLTGYHPDRNLLQRAGVGLDPSTCLPEHDPDTLETNVRNLFLAGGVISGNDTAPVFIENGRLHGERAIRVISERLRPEGL